MSAVTRIGLVGFGEIAQNQHVPAVAATQGLELVAIADPARWHPMLPSYASLEDLLMAQTVDAVILCQPPSMRFAAARAAIQARKHMFLEKSPGATVNEVRMPVELGRANNVALFAGWHSRYAAGMDAAKRWIAERTVERATITWKEDVRKWHPGQTWIWQAGGFRVFDPGINALSFIADIIKSPLRVMTAKLDVPANCATPIRAMLTMKSLDRITIEVEFDWRHTGPETWDIVLESGSETACLREGGHRIDCSGKPDDATVGGEYLAMYRHFMQLMNDRVIDVDLGAARIAG